MKTPVSIAMFFLLSAFFLFALLAALQHSRKALAVAVVCLAAVVCIIIFLTPVRLPDWWPGNDSQTTTTVSATGAMGLTAFTTPTTALGGEPTASTTEARR